MAVMPQPELTGRQRDILRRVVEEYVSTGQPVGSKYLVERAGLRGSPLRAATVRHIEVLRLQPAVVMVVVITSAGGVGKRVITFAEPVDAGLVSWAAEYLNDQLAGVELGSRRLRGRLDDPALGPRE